MEPFFLKITTSRQFLSNHLLLTGLGCFIFFIAPMPPLNFSTKSWMVGLLFLGSFSISYGYFRLDTFFSTHYSGLPWSKASLVKKSLRDLKLFVFSRSCGFCFNNTLNRMGEYLRNAVMASTTLLGRSYATKLSHF